MVDLLSEIVGLEQAAANLTVITALMDSEEGRSYPTKTFTDSIRAVRDSIESISKALEQKQ